MTRRVRIFALGLAILLGAAGPVSAGGAHNARPIVIELYTSQGCSSCPPADALLGKLAKRPGVIALTLPITYWDMLGWRDTLANEVNTRRQKGYAALMGRGGVYTPQIIVDGAIDVVGSRAPNVDAAIAARQAAIANSAYLVASSARAVASDAARAAEATGGAVAALAPPAPPPSPAGRVNHVEPLVPVTVRHMPQEMRIDIGAAVDASTPQNATVWLFHIRNQATVKVDAGENEGRTLTYHNVVGDMRAVGVWKGRALTLTLPRAAMAGLPHDGVAVVVQQNGYGHVVGAAYVNRPDYYAAQ